MAIDRRRISASSGDRSGTAHSVSNVCSYRQREISREFRSNSHEHPGLRPPRVAPEVAHPSLEFEVVVIGDRMAVVGVIR